MLTATSLLGEEGAHQILVENPRLLLESRSTGKGIVPGARPKGEHEDAALNRPLLQKLFSLGRKQGP